MKQNEKLLSTIFYKLILILFAFIICLVLVMNILFSQNIDYSCKNGVTVSNGILLLSGLLVLLLFGTVYNIFFRRYVNHLSKAECNILLIVGCISLFILQLYIAYNIYFLSGWDVGILRDASTYFADNQVLDSQCIYSFYFARYPNNVFLTFIFTIIKQITMFIGSNNLDFSLVIGGILLLNISAWFITKCAAIIFKDRYYSILTLFIYSIYIALSPWMVIPYSDTYSIVFTVMVLYFYFNRKNMNSYIAWGLIFSLSMIGYLIKPTCIIVLIAILLIEFWKFIFYSNKEKLKCSRYLLVLFSCIMILMSLKSLSYNYLGYRSSEKERFPLSHFLMMGMNPVTKGVYYGEDVNYTGSFIGEKEKVNANLEMINNRLNDYGISGYFKLLCEKLMTNYNDGTFAWGVEGNFYAGILEPPNKTVAKTLRDIYYSEGKYYGGYEVYQQTIWIMILFFMLFSIKRLINEVEKDLYVIILTIIGITMFLLLFEARARYLFLYSPYYILLAVVGIQCFIKFMHRKLVLK